MMNNPNNQELIELLSKYFKQRGKFLAKIIKADLNNSQLESHYQALEVQEFLRPETNSLKISAAAPASNQIALAVEQTANQQPPEISPKNSTEKILVDLIVEQTGYPPESITLDAKLLDDLNLDSIKSAEVVAQTAQKIGLEGQIDPSIFANATLMEIIQALDEFSGAEETTTNEDKSSQAGSQEILNPWVRNFAVEYVAESASLDQVNDPDSSFAKDDWTKAKVLIVSDSLTNTWAESLQEELSQLEAQVKIINFGELPQLESGDYSHIMAIIPPIGSTESTKEECLTTAVTQLRNVGAFPKHRGQGYSNVSFIQFGGGYFGKGEEIGSLETSCTIGFAASLHLERTDLKVRVIDLPRKLEPNLLSKSVIAEIARPQAYLAVGFDAELTRRIPRPCLQDRATYKPRNISWSNQDVVLVTGGAKGITAECTLAWAAQTGVSLALVGSSPHPTNHPNGKSSAEIESTLQRFAKADLTCNYYQCDVSDRNALSALVEVIGEELGQVTGVIHGAAINRAKPVNKSTAEEALAEVKPKIMGAINLAEIFQANPLKLFTGFSSIGAVVGLPGNTWYSFSNEALDLILRNYQQQHPETEILSLAYSVWSEVGMGAKMGAVSGLARMGIGAISRQEGVERFVQLMAENPGDSQVVLVARIDGSISRQHNFDTWLPLRVAPPSEFKFLEQVLMYEPGVETIARTHLTLEKDSYIKDHIYKGSYLFPTVFGLEAMAQTVAYTLGLESFSSLLLENISLERPLVVHPENGLEIEIFAEVAERTQATDPLTVHVEIRSATTGFTKAHFAADFVLKTDLKLQERKISQPLISLDIQPQQDLYGWLLFQGARFQRIQEIYSLDSQQMVFLTEKQDFSVTNLEDRAEGPFILGDPYYRDSLLHSVQPIVPDDLCLPLSIAQIEIHLTEAQLENYCIGIAIREETANSQHDTTVIVLNRNSQVVEKLSGYQIKIMEHIASNPTAEELADPETRDRKILHYELNQRAKALGIEVPQVELTYVPSSLSHKEKQNLFSKTLNSFLNKIERQL